MGCRRVAGLTLIELLIVVAIIGVLASIGVYHLLQAQIRAKVSTSKQQLRVLAGAIESYRADYGSYPWPIATYPEDPYGVLAASAMRSLTTPIAYVSPGAFHDPFGTLRVQFTMGKSALHSEHDPFRPPTPGFNNEQSLLSFYYPHFSLLIGEMAMWAEGYSVVSVGPDRADSFIVYYPFPDSLPQAAARYGILRVEDAVYDPTNGTISRGDLAHFGGLLPTGGQVGGGDP